MDKCVPNLWHSNGFIHFIQPNDTKRNILKTGNQIYMIYFFNGDKHTQINNKIKEKLGKKKEIFK